MKRRPFLWRRFPEDPRFPCPMKEKGRRRKRGSFRAKHFKGEKSREKKTNEAASKEGDSRKKALKRGRVSSSEEREIPPGPLDPGRVRSKPSRKNKTRQKLSRERTSLKGKGNFITDRSIIANHATPNRKGIEKIAPGKENYLPSWRESPLEVERTGARPSEEKKGTDSLN